MYDCVEFDDYPGNVGSNKPFYLSISRSTAEFPLDSRRNKSLGSALSGDVTAMKANAVHY